MTLHLYFARRYLSSFGLIFGAFLLIVFFFDLVDKLAGFAPQGVGFATIVGLTALSVPRGMYEILPLIVVLATVALFIGLARSSELAVTRAAGRSALMALVAPVTVAFLIGAISVAVFNPIVAATGKEFDRRVSEIRNEGASILSLFEDAVWLRQGSAAGQTVIRAEGANLDGTELTRVTFVTFAPDGGPVRRIEASRAVLTPGAWEIFDAKSWPLVETGNPEADAETFPVLTLGSTLTADQIRDSFGMPSSIPVWELPRFIERLQAAGFSARRHQVWLHRELATPVLLVAMVLIASGFTMRHQRGARTGLMVLSAILLCFALFFVRNFAEVLGENGNLPVGLAAWAPPFGAIGLALGLLLHLEDG